MYVYVWTGVCVMVNLTHSPAEEEDFARGGLADLGIFFAVGGCTTRGCTTLACFHGGCTGGCTTLAFFQWWRRWRDIVEIFMSQPRKRRSFSHHLLMFMCKPIYRIKNSRRLTNFACPQAFRDVSKFGSPNQTSKHHFANTNKWFS